MSATIKHLTFEKIVGKFRLFIHVVVIDSGVEGPTVVCVGGTHGNEYQGMKSVRRMLNAPEIQLERGRLILISIVNVRGALAGIREFPWRGKLYDLNRLFPGDPDGNVPDQLADLVFRNILSFNPAFVVDFHAWSRRSVSAFALLANPSTEKGKKAFQRALRIAEQSGAVVCVDGMDDEHSERELSCALLEKGIPAMVVEHGPMGDVSEKSIKDGLGLTRNILGALGMAPKSNFSWRSMPRIDQDQPLVLRDVRHQGSPAIISRFVVCPGQKVKKGDVIACVTDGHGREIAARDILAPGDGYIIALEEEAAIRRGDLVAAIGVKQK